VSGATEGGSDVPTYTGNNGSNTISGSNADDIIYGLGGHDDLFGKAGHDIIFGGTGSDEIDGGNGDDTLYGEDGDDEIDGGSGNDTAYGGDGNDDIDGGSGDDALFGDDDGDWLSGGSGNDTISGGDGHDLLLGGAGDDTLAGNGGIDLIDGGSGTDTAVFSGSLADYTIYRLGPVTSVLHDGLGGPGSGADGADLMVRVERLQFADVSIDLTANNAPFAVDDAVALDEDDGAYDSGAASVLDNDFDFEGDALTVIPAVIAGTYGTLTLDADGTYEYVLDASAQALAQGAVVQDGFAYTVTDGSASDTADLVFTVTGLNDAPVASPDTAGTDENAAVLIDVLSNDSDVDNGAILTVTAAAAPPGQGTAAVVGNQVEFDPGADFDYLAVDESVDIVVSYGIEDEHGATASSSVTITVTGTNDAPTIDAGGTDADGSVTELPNDDPDENAFTHADSGTIAFADPDLSDTHSASFAPQAGGYLGTFALDPVNQSGNSVGWTFSVEDADIDFLEDGETLVQTYTVEIDDGNGGTTSQDVTVTITGAADNVPPDGTNWYIDNSFVGGLNDGSIDDPFTSIAAFNAAQGTPGGPGVGDNVFILAGTGVYAEADGVNLLDGQTLTGVPDGLLRPTIQPGAGNGVDLADNNVLSGFDIVATAGDGIVDTAATSGSVTISDVGVTTSSGSGIVLDTAAGVSIANVSVISTGSYAIVAANVAGFALEESTVTGSSSADAALAFTELTGTASFLGNSLAGSGGDVVRIVTTAGSLDLTMADGANEAEIGLNDASSGDDGMIIETGGTASLTLTIDGVDFHGAVSDLLAVVASGSSTQDLTIVNSNFVNTHAGTTAGGGGVLLAASAGSNVTVDYVFADNVLQGADGNAVSAIYSQDSGDVRGYIAGNVIGLDDGLGGFEGSAGGGAGIFVALDRAAGQAGSATHSVNIVDNEIRDIAFGVAGIHLVSNGGGAGSGSVLEATLTGNTVEELGEFAFAAFYAIVGGGAGSGDFAQLGLDLDGNTLDASGALFGGNAVYLDQISTDAHYYVPGYAGSPDGEFLGGTASADLDAFWSGSNTFINGAFPSFPGGVDAGFIMGATGDAFIEPVWFG
jgi:VCBS repeat-containing protein